MNGDRGRGCRAKENSEKNRRDEGDTEKTRRQGVERVKE